MTTKWATWVVPAMIIGAWAPSAFCADQNAPAEVLGRTDAIRAPTKAWSFKLQVRDYKNEQLKSESEFKIYVRGSNEDVYRSLVLWSAPIADKGKVMLMDGNVYWLYSPGTRHAIRISAAQRFAGLASTADIASVNFKHDYEVKSMTPDSTTGQEALKLAMVAKTDEVAYPALELIVRADDYSPIQCKYFALSGRLLKTAYFAGFHADLGEKRPHEIRIVDAVDPSHTTKLIYSSLTLEEKPRQMYRKDYLPNIQE